MNAKRAAVVFASVALLMANSTWLRAQEPAPKEYYQDFRQKRPLLEAFRLTGPDSAEVTKAEDEGLRITLPGERDHHWAVEVAPNFPLTGDFEMTGTYEILSGARPAKGYGVGVNLVVADNEKRKKFGKICRVYRVNEGSVHLTEYWAPYQLRSKKTEAKSGQLRLTRVGATMRYLVSDGPGEQFREIWFQKSFGVDDLHHVGFGVTDSGEPNNPVDARLIDLRIRMGVIPSEKAVDPAPLAAPAPLPEAAPPLVGETSSSRTVMVIVLAGVAATVVLTLVVAIVVVYHLPRRPTNKPSKKPADSAPLMVACSACGQKLKTRTALAGKKVKCTQCGKPVLVPTPDEADP
jgi:hypothetical protein